MKSLTDLQRELELRAEALAPHVGVSFLAPMEEFAEELRDQDYIESIRDNIDWLTNHIESSMNLKLYFLSLESIHTIRHPSKELLTKELL